MEKNPGLVKAKPRKRRAEHVEQNKSSWTPDHNVQRDRPRPSLRTSSSGGSRRSRQIAGPSRTNWLVIFESAAAAGVLAWAAWFFLTSPHYIIRHIHIEGLETVRSKVVGAAAGVPASKNIFLYLMEQRHDICTRVKNCDPAIADATIGVELPDTVVLHVVERQPYAVLHLLNGSSYLMDQNRVAYRQIAPNQSVLPFVTIPTPGSLIVEGASLPADADGHVQSAYAVLGLLADRQIGPLNGFREVAIDDNENANLRLDNGLIIKLGQQDGMPERLDDLETALTAEPSLISEAQYLDFTTNRYAVMKKPAPLTVLTGNEHPIGQSSPLSEAIGQ